MNIVSVIERMEAQGMDPSAIVAAVKCMAAEQADEIARRRASDRARQARHRAKTADCHVTERDTPVTERDTPSPLVPPLSPTPPNPPYNPPIQSKPTRAKPATDLPSGWEMDGKTWQLAEELGFTAREASDQLDRMRDWARNAGPKGRKTDWNAAFRNWLKRAADDRRNKPQTAVQRNSLADSFAILDAVTDEAIRRTDGRREEGGEETPFPLPGLRTRAA
jgi:hypothetical protein